MQNYNKDHFKLQCKRQISVKAFCEICAIWLRLQMMFPCLSVRRMVLLGYFPGHFLLFGSSQPCLPSCEALATPQTVIHAVNSRSLVQSSVYKQCFTMCSLWPRSQSSFWCAFGDLTSRSLFYVCLWSHQVTEFEVLLGWDYKSQARLKNKMKRVSFGKCISNTSVVSEPRVTW